MAAEHRAEVEVEQPPTAHTEPSDEVADERLEECSDLSDGSEEDSSLRARTWRERYAFAERDARRTVIRLSELCGDFGCGQARVWDIYGYPPPYSGRHEGVFRRDGTYSDTGLFRGQRATCFVVQGSGGESSVRYGPHWEYSFSALRTEDWGWQLVHPHDKRAPIKSGDARRFLMHFLPSERFADMEWEKMVHGLAPISLRPQGPA